MSEHKPLLTPEQTKTFLSTLSSHDARHNLCVKCGRTVILVEGKWLHNRTGYVADHAARPGSKLTAGSREFFVGDEIIVDPFLAPTRARTPEIERKLREAIRHERKLREAMRHG